MTISFIIPAYNEEKYVGQCIESILKRWHSDFLEIIIADNASTDRTGEVAAKFPHVKVVRENRKGTNWARQAGFAVARGDLVACLDADVQIPDGWREKVIAEFTNDPKLVSLSGPFHYYDMPPSKNFLAQTLWGIFAPPTYWIKGFMALGANMVIRREALASIGGFDTRILFHGDDTDTARRLSKVGKVKFKMSFYILGSGRRLMKDGLIKTFWAYGMNYLWAASNRGPYTKESQDAPR